ncbi:unnamed protein product, partial [Didymodactylos carnosus]
ATAAPSTAMSKRTKVVWFWQSNSNPLDDAETKEWRRYSDFESEFVEEKYQKKNNEVQLS